jgi:hypothetical protein
MEPSNAILVKLYQSTKVHGHHLSLWASRQPEISYFGCEDLIGFRHKDV